MLVTPENVLAAGGLDDPRTAWPHGNQTRPDDDYLTRIALQRWESEGGAVFDDDLGDFRSVRHEEFA
ncbi:hypothetical protein CQY20_20525 [Mycolicibacterium agri]|uniref:Uncharacterized protein n=1 Tax=Mycolicibacterium agri TaxID=36811 RepID=A0A2A7MWQ0_MYCAG|nr:hypothetical protein [Mycolicibacterium agri]PEG35917.1 hypothetical protein CQY20_20525 [Mycolicibacterium agri]GFG54242.1 hypothetical protein MAGR_56830 [Mycolicibacterium agri]